MFGMEQIRQKKNVLQQNCISYTIFFCFATKTYLLQQLHLSNTASSVISVSRDCATVENVSIGNSSLELDRSYSDQHFD